MLPELPRTWRQLLQLSEVLLAEFVNGHPVDMLDYLLLNLLIPGSPLLARAGVFLLCACVRLRPTNFRLESAFIHLLVVNLKALSELLQALFPLQVPLEVALIGRALLTSVVPLLVLFVLVAGHIGAGKGCRMGVVVMVNWWFSREDSGLMLQIIVEIVKGGYLRRLRWSSQDLWRFCVVVW